MKKLILGAALSAAFFSSFVSATPIESNTPIILTDCALLQDDVTLTLSNGVLGAYECIDAANSVLVATCHANGRTASRSSDIPCVNTISADPDIAATQTQCDDPAVAFNRESVEGPSVYIGNTSGGSIGPTLVDGAVCDAALVDGSI